jgi:hypothetical protein
VAALGGAACGVACEAEWPWLLPPPLLVVQGGQFWQCLEARSSDGGAEDALGFFGGGVTAGCVGDIGDVMDGEARARRTVNVRVAETL